MARSSRSNQGQKHGKRRRSSGQKNSPPGVAQLRSGLIGAEWRRPSIEPLENRQLLSTVSFLEDGVSWVAVGPAPILNGQAENVPTERPVVGAVQAIVADKTNPNIVFIGTANGGVWRSESLSYANDGLDNDGKNGIDDPGEVWTATYNTDNFDNDHDGLIDAADPDEVQWTALTDTQQSLAIGDLTLDPNDPTGNTLIAGIGRTSSAAFRGGPSTGVLMITNAKQPTLLGGATVTRLGLPAGRNISGVASGQTASGDPVVLVAANANGIRGSQASLAGVYRIVKPGQPDEQVTFVSGTSNLTIGPAYDVIVDPTNLKRFYV